MKKSVRHSTWGMLVTIPLAIIIIASTITLIIPDMYTFHFDATLVTRAIPYNITDEELAEEIVKFNLSKDTAKFQIYEDNGIYQDPIITYHEQHVMAKAKELYYKIIIFGCIMLILSIISIIILWNINYKKTLRTRGLISLGITAALIWVFNTLLSKDYIREWCYNKFIGITMEEDLIVPIVFGGEFYKTYGGCTAIIGFILLALALYFLIVFTKPPRIFY